MDKICVLITGAGAPGAPGIIKSIRLNGEREIEIIGVDIDDVNSSGMLMVDHFYKVPSPENKQLFIESIIEIAVRHGVKVIIPLVTKELFIFSENIDQFLAKGIQVLVSDFETLLVANDKGRLMSFCAINNIPVPEFYSVTTFAEFEKAAEKLGYPEKTICFKPPVSNGLRGFRIITKPGKIDKLDILLNQKPNDVYISYSEFEDIIKHAGYFPELLVMEFIEGVEFSVDALADNGKCVEAIPRSRDKIKMGISFAGTLVQDMQIIQYCKQIISELKLHGNIGLQFIKDKDNVPKLIESNPRVQGTIVFNTAGGFNMVYNAIKVALKEPVANQEIKWGMKMIRYWEEVYFYEGHGFGI